MSADATETADPAIEPRHSAGPVIALGLAAFVLIAAVVVALVGGDDVRATAVRVNSSEVSQKTFNSQLRSLASTARSQPGSVSAAGFTDAFVPSALSAQLGTLHVVGMLMQSDLDARGVHVTDAQRAAFADANRQTLAAYPKDFQDFVVDVNVVQQAYVKEHGQAGSAEALRRLARRSDISVDPRYGFWNPALAQVCPPTGCAASAATSTSGG